jgi:hypothetical protein
MQFSTLFPPSGCRHQRAVTCPDQPREGRVCAMQRAIGYAGAWNIDMSRAAQELLPPLGASYGAPDRQSFD